MIRFSDYLKDYLEAYNISNKDFANRIGITPKHLIDILDKKVELSRSVITKISLVTGISTDYIYKIEDNYKLENSIKDYLNKENITESNYLKKFNISYLKKSNYIDFTDESNNLENIKDILKFLRITTPNDISKIDNGVYFKSKCDKPELELLWLEKCFRQTHDQVLGEYKKENIELLVEYIKDCALNNEFNEEKLKDKFNECGIYLVIQDDIPKSKIRGAFRVHRDKPAIYLTHKHKRIADIYYALLHELAHCKSDFNKAKSYSLISLDDDINTVESRADITAFNWMVDNEYYNNICKGNDYNIDNETNYPKSFIVYRLASDNIIKYNSSTYQRYNIVLNIK